MKRLALVLALTAAAQASAFSLITAALTPAPPLVWFECSAPSTGAAPEGTDFIPRFVPYGLRGLDGGGSFFGFDQYQFDSITCGWGSAGVTSGGTDVMRIQLIQKSDAGIVCSCDLPGLCTDNAGSEHTCSCDAGVRYLTGQAALNSGYACQLNTATNCGTNPGFFQCAIPFRK